MKSLKKVILSGLLLLGASQMVDARPILFNPADNTGSNMMEVVDRPILFSNTASRPILFSVAEVEVRDLQANAEVTVWGINKKQVEVEIVQIGNEVRLELPKGNYIIQVVEADGKAYQHEVKVK